MTPAIKACAEIVERDDPHLFATTLFASVPVRERLLVLYAFDCELSRATRASKESLIPRMRLQWWSDVVQGALGDDPAPQHEVAAPLTALIRADPGLQSDLRELPGQDVLSRMIRGHMAGLEAPFTQAVYQDWSQDRFGARLGMAGNVMPAPDDVGHCADISAASEALALGFALRNAARMLASEGCTLLPDLRGADLAAMARGTMPDSAGQALADRAGAARADLKALRRSRGRLGNNALVAHLPLMREERALRAVARDPASVLGQLDDIDRPFDGLRLAWRSWRRRW